MSRHRHSQTKAPAPQPEEEPSFTDLASRNPLAAIFHPIIGNAKKVGKGASDGVHSIEGALAGFMNGDANAGKGVFAMIMEWLFQLPLIGPMLQSLMGGESKPATGQTEPAQPSPTTPGPSQSTAQGQDAKTQIVTAGLNHAVTMLPPEILSQIPESMKNQIITEASVMVSKEIGNVTDQNIETSIHHAVDKLAEQHPALNMIKGQLYEVGTKGVKGAFNAASHATPQRTAQTVGSH